MNVVARNKVFALRFPHLRATKFTGAPGFVGNATFRSEIAHRMEARIRDLCSALLNTKEPESIEKIGEQLRCAIHDYVEEMRLQVNDLPIVTSMLQTS